MQLRSRHTLTLFVLLVGFALAGVMHGARGALSSGFGAADDEAAHLVSGVMVHDYLIDHEPLHPVRYAENYYTHYPKVAIGQWPPGYYGLQAAWTLIFGVSRESIVLLGAALMATIAAMLYAALAEDLGQPPALAAALLFLLLPLVQRLGAMTMTELPLSMFCLAAVFAFGRLMDRNRWRDGIAFALFASAAILTKANGLALALLPFFAILIARRWSLLRSRPFWLSGLLVAILAGPWTLRFLEVNQSTWGGGAQPSVAFLLHAAPYHAAGLSALGGALVLACALWGAKVRIGTANASGLWITTGAWCLAVYVFHSVIPSSIERRHMLLLAPGLCMLAAAGSLDLAARLAPPARQARLAGAALLLAAFAAIGWSFPLKRFTGFEAAVAYIDAQPQFDRHAVLIDSGAIGEGLAISEFVLIDDERPSRHVLRATKFLSRSTWTGDEYVSLFETPESMADALAEIPVGIVLFDHSVNSHQRMPHHLLLQRMLRVDPHWQLVQSFDVQRGVLQFPQGLELWACEGVDRMTAGHLEFDQVLGREVPFHEHRE